MLSGLVAVVAAPMLNNTISMHPWNGYNKQEATIELRKLFLKNKASIMVPLKVKYDGWLKFKCLLSTVDLI